MVNNQRLLCMSHKIRLVHRLLNRTSASLTQQVLCEKHTAGERQGLASRIDDRSPWCSGFVEAGMTGRGSRDSKGPMGGRCANLRSQFWPLRVRLIRSTGPGDGPDGRERPGSIRAESDAPCPTWLSSVYNWLFSEFLTHLGFLLALVLMAGLLRQRRSPSSTIAWLLVILLLPYIGVPLYIMFGGRKMQRMARARSRSTSPRPSRTAAISAGPWNGCSPRMACRRPPPATGSSWSPTGVDAYQRRDAADRARHARPSTSRPTSWAATTGARPWLIA